MRGGGKRVKRRARSEYPGEPPPTPDESMEGDGSDTGDEPTVLDKIREMKWRHAACVDDMEASPGDMRGVRDNESSGEP